MPETRSKHLMKSNKLSPDLAAIVGKTEASKIELIKLLWAYLKKNKLECKDNKQFFLPDKKMAKVFGTDRIQGFSMAKHIQAHLTPIDTINDSDDVKNDSGDAAGDSDDFEIILKNPVLQQGVDVSNDAVNDLDDFEIIFKKQPKKQEPKQGGDDSNQEPMQGDDDSNQEPMQGDDDSNQEQKQGDDDSNQEPMQGDDDSNQEQKQGDDDSNQEPEQGDDDSNQEPKQVDDDSNQELKQGDDDSNDDSNQEPKQGDYSDARAANYTHHINACPFENLTASLDDDSNDKAYDFAINQWKIDGDNRNENKIQELKKIILACLPKRTEGVIDDAAFKKKSE